MHNYIYNEIYICIRYCSYKHSTFRLHHQPCQVQQKPDALNLQPTFSHKPSTYLNLWPQKRVVRLMAALTFLGKVSEKSLTI